MELFSNYNDDLARMVWKDGTYYYQWNGESRLIPIMEKQMHFWNPQLLQIQKQLRKLKLEKLLKED